MKLDAKHYAKKLETQKYGKSNIFFPRNSKICSYPAKYFYIIEILLHVQSKVQMMITDFLYLSLAFWYQKSDISSDSMDKLCDLGKAKTS